MTTRTPVEPRLSDLRKEQHRYQGLKGEFRQFVLRHRDDELAWSMAGSLLPLLRARAMHETPSTPTHSRVTIMRERARSARAAIGRGQPMISQVDGFFFSGRGHSVIRVQEQVAKALDAPVSSLPQRATTVMPWRTWRASRRAIDHARELLSELRAVDIALPCPGDYVIMHAIICSRWLLQIESLLDRCSPRAVMTTTTGGMPDRAVIAVCRRLGTPSVYLPHASVLWEVDINDLPTDFVGLRGPREADWYVNHGAAADRLSVCGNVTLPPLTPAAPREGEPVVLAPTDVREDLLREMVDVVRAAGVGPVTVSPHPKTDPELVRGIIPAEWSFWDGRTYEALARGACAVVQNSSGTALEGALLGVPPIQLAFPGTAPNYPLLSEPHVRHASRAGELRSAVAAAAEIRADPDAVARLRDWARGWCSPIGDDAAVRAVSLLHRAAEEGPRGPILDLWTAAPPAT